MCTKVSPVLVLYLITFCGYTVQYMLLTNLNIAMTVMNEKPQFNRSLIGLNSSYPGNWTYDKNYYEGEKKFSWNESEEGLLLSAVFWLLWLSHPVGGTLSHKLGAKIVIATSVFLGSCISLLIPSASFIHMRVLLVVRVIQGFILGLAFPSIMSVIQFWVSENKKGKFLTCFLGISMGAAITYFISGFIIDAFSWEGVFYVTGSIGILWCGAWWYLMFNKPELHPRLTEKEKQAIYAKTKINLPIENVTGIVSGIAHFLRVIFSIVYAAFTDKIVSKKIVSKTCARKLGIVASHLIPGLALIMLAFKGENFPIAVSSIYICVAFTGAIVSGSFAGLSDMSPNYAGVIMGLSGALSHTSGLLSPLLIGYLTLNNDTPEQWQYIFLISAGIGIGAGLLFLIFWSSDLQKWDRPYSKVPDQNSSSLGPNEKDRTK